ncbi:MAG: hypothetical protein R3250_01535 [Melioribacteraceae bacterium]|nr:hypothetical protein [Melioribacteraceae bacterium]
MANLNEIVNRWSEKISQDLLKDFPDQFIEGKEYSILGLPGKPLLKGSHLFGAYEVIDVEGELVFSSNSLNEIKYVLYSNRKNPKEIKFLSSKEELEDAVVDYENHIDNILVLLKNDLASNFPSSSNVEQIINKIFRILNLQRY